MNQKTAHREYNKILKSVKKRVGGKTTYLGQLDKAGKDIFGSRFHGVYPSDKIPKLTDRKPYAILNLDRSDEPGSHWIALAKVIDNRGVASLQGYARANSIVYDSFGRHHTKIIPSLLYSGNGKLISTDDDQEQHIMATDCGARSISWLEFLDKYGAENSLLI